MDRWGHAKVALDAFAWMETNSNPQQSFDTADPFLYTRLMSMCGPKAAGYRSALQIFHSMQSKDIKPDLVAYNTVINAAGVYKVHCTVDNLRATAVQCLHCCKDYMCAVIHTVVAEMA